MWDFLGAALVLFAASAGIVIWQWKVARSDRKAAGLRQAERGRGT